MPESVTVNVDGIGSVTLAGAGNLTMDDFADWVDAEREARLRDARPFLAKLVSKWDLPYDPVAPSSYGRLTLAQYRGLSRAVTDYLGNISKN